MWHNIFGDWSIINWIVIAAYLVGTTIIGERLKGQQATIKDFFLGGHRLHWMAVCGSIIATEVSAVTFIIVPMIVFAPKGNFTYLQLAIGTILARFIIGIFFVPEFYRKEIYSPYQYMGNKLGPRVNYLTSLIFFIGAILGQSIRVYVTALVIKVVLGTSIPVSIAIIGMFSILWTFIGGITTVIWTDVVQFIVFLFGAAIALYYISQGVDGGIWQVFSQSAQAGKFEILNLSFSPTEAYTLWCGLFATVFLTLASHGTDQMMAQRMFCCKNARDASKAIIWSSVSQIVTILMLVVGAGLFVYYQAHPVTGKWAGIMANDAKYVFPIFIYTVLPVGISGLLIAAILAAAISSLDSTLAALSQTFISSFYKPFIRREASEKHYMVASKIMIVLWGVVLCLMALAAEYLEKFFPDLVQLALAMTSYTYGALLGTFLLALLPLNRDDRGLIWAIPYSVLITFSLSWHQVVPRYFVMVALACILVYSFYYLPRSERAASNSFLTMAFKLALILVGAALILFVGNYQPDGKSFIKLAWPWNFPIGAVITLLYGYCLGRPKTQQPS